MKETIWREAEPAMRTVPRFVTRRCRWAAAGLTLLLNWGPLAAGGAGWLLYDWTVAVAATVLVFLLVGIITSKLRYLSVPPDSGETVHKTSAVVRWYLARNLCEEEEWNS